MKKCLVNYLALGFSLFALPFLGGCTQSADGSNPFVSSASADTIDRENNLAAVNETATNAPEVAVEAATDVVAATDASIITTNTVVTTNTAAESEMVGMEEEPPTEQKPPPNLHLSPVLSEAIKIIQSGVDQSVLHNFITNTTGYFSLGADEIVYLNDLGVEGSAITAMMEHDRALRELRANAWQAYAASNQTAQLLQPQPSEPELSEPDMAAAPSYVEPPALEAEPVYVSNSYFYDTLSPYGTWVYVPGFGRCWRPTVAYRNPGWRPYCDRGRWVYSDSGWYWLSDYTWGATTFHYGRWFNDARFGWCWWPDTVWAPSWVSWRYTSDYCGWAPLPPNCYYQSGFGLVYTSGSVGVSFGFGLGYNSYAFVPWKSFCSPRPYQYCVPASTAVHVYNKSRPYNHWEGDGKGRAFNRGLAPDRVRDFSRQEVRTVSIKEERGRNNVRAERIDRDGRTLAIRRPQFASTSGEVNNVSPATTRSAPRATTPRSTDSTASLVQRPTTTASTSVPSSPTRVNRGDQREQRIPNRNVVRATSPVTSAAEPAVSTEPAVTKPVRVENRSDSRVEASTVNRQRPTSSVVTRPAQRQTPVATTTERPSVEAKASEPRVVQPNRQAVSRPSTPAPRSSIIVIGGNNNNTRSGGRDYSVWSTSPQRPAPTVARDNNSSSRGSQPTSVGSQPTMPVNTPQVADHSPAPASPVSRPQNGNWQSRGSFNRPDNVGAIRSQNNSAPQVRQVTVPSARSVPSVNYNARPAQAAVPSQSYAPRSQPSTQPAVRSESRPAPAQSSRPSAPAAPQSAQGRGRPNR